ncbi:MAG: hypothetical protein AAF840_18050, partial [Bacteroidota bacterium]
YCGVGDEVAVGGAIAAIGEAGEEAPATEENTPAAATPEPEPTPVAEMPTPATEAPEPWTLPETLYVILQQLGLPTVTSGKSGPTSTLTSFN